MGNKKLKFDIPLFDSLIDIASKGAGEGVDELTKALDRLADGQTNSTAQLALRLTSHYVQEHGPKGIEFAKNEIKRIAKGQEMVLDVQNERTAHLILAAREEREHLTKQRVKAIFEDVAQVFSAIFVNVLGAASK